MMHDTTLHSLSLVFEFVKIPVRNTYLLALKAALPSFRKHLHAAIKLWTTNQFHFDIVILYDLGDTESHFYIIPFAYDYE